MGFSGLCLKLERPRVTGGDIWNVCLTSRVRVGQTPTSGSPWEQPSGPDSSQEGQCLTHYCPLPSEDRSITAFLVSICPPYLAHGWSVPSQRETRFSRCFRAERLNILWLLNDFTLKRQYDRVNITSKMGKLSRDVRIPAVCTQELSAHLFVLTTPAYLFLPPVNKGE